jgi:hypothetical protein
VHQSPYLDQGYRYPSPDKQSEGVNVPSSDGKERVYNTQYYTRDIRRFPFPLAVGVHPSIPQEKRAELPADLPRGSPGNKVRPCLPQSLLGVESNAVFFTLRRAPPCSRTTPRARARPCRRPTVRRRPRLASMADGRGLTRLALPSPLSEARDKLILQQLSTHTVRFEWEAHQDEILEEAEAKGIPAAPGRPFQWDMPTQSRVRRW